MKIFSFVFLLITLASCRCNPFTSSIPTNYKNSTFYTKDFTLKNSTLLTETYYQSIDTIFNNSHKYRISRIAFYKEGLVFLESFLSDSLSTSNNKPPTFDYISKSCNNHEIGAFKTYDSIISFDTKDGYQLHWKYHSGHIKNKTLTIGNKIYSAL